MVEKNQMKFTFYGDLLGIGGAYKLGPKVAHEKLNRFYNRSYFMLEELQRVDRECEIEMFSDTIFIIGSKLIHAIENIGLLFSELLIENLFLRGALVSGKLSYEPRITRSRFRKKLPDDDTLSRATGLEKSVKGARFILENNVVQKLFENIPEWMTNEDYQRNANLTPDNHQILRRICPTPDGDHYEYLYFWREGMESVEFKNKIIELKNLQKMQSESQKQHYKETIGLIRRSELRKKI